MPATDEREIVLASTSRYRQALLERLRIRFHVAAPGTDETPLPGEAPDALALRLAEAKARSVTREFPRALIIGCDQVAVVDTRTLPKPGNHERAFAQLKSMRGRAISFFTALCLLDARSGMAQLDLVLFTAHMREYSDAQIGRYLAADTPYDCAGSARIEGLGISLVSKLAGDDPTALIGLPLIRLCTMLAEAGIELP